MHPNFLAICSYFAPLILTAIKIGFGSTVLITSHIQSAAISVQFERILMENFEFKEAGSESWGVPSDSDVKNFFETLAHKMISCNKYQVVEAIHFYHEAVRTSEMTVEQIAAEALTENSNSNTIYKKYNFLDNGNKSDRYGLLKLMRNVSYESAKNSINQRHLLKKEQLEILSFQKLESMYTKFKTAEKLTVESTVETDRFWLFLKDASKSQLKKYGINAECHIFQHRDEYATKVSDSIFNPNNEVIIRLIRYVINTITDETIEIEEKKSDLDNYIIEVVGNSKALVETYLNETPINYEGIKVILAKIDEHLNSAAQSALRVKNFIYGSELAPYPKFLVRQIISKDDYAYLERLTVEHPDGIKGVYANDQEEIFITAYEKDKANGKRWIKLLTRTGFNFSDDQKKALFRDIIRENDCELLHLMVQNKRLNLFEYQKDRGITFYHLLLIEGSEQLVEHAHSNYIIEEPELKVKFIPNYPQQQQQGNACPYWSPHENNFNLQLRNFDLPGMKIRKNWDFLMIAAANGRIKIVRALMDKSVDTKGYEKIKDYLRDQTIIATICLLPLVTEIHGRHIVLLLLSPMPEPQTLNEIDEKEREIIEKKEAILKESFEDDKNDNLKMTEKIPLDLDSYNFDAFISKMRHESCRPVLENIKRFIKVFLDKLPTSNIEEMVEAYKSFYSVIKLKCLQAEIWRSEDTSALERANALEGLESLIMNQLHDRVITFDSSERDLDNFMERKMALHAGWIKMEHLDVAESVCKHLEETEGAWISTAVTEFQKMSVYRTPRDKLVCALNGCKIINSLINGNEMSADDFLPLLIYTLIRANPPQIYSNINYISRFRAPERITGETAYCFTHLMAAIEFIEKMDRSALKISDESYETFMEAAIEEFNHRESSQDSLEISFNEKLDIAEAKAEELFIKAKEAFKVTGERANQAFSSFKESNLAKKSMEKINKFFKDLSKPETEKETEKEKEKEKEQEDFESQLARAVSLSLLDESIELESESENEKDEKEDTKESKKDTETDDNENQDKEESEDYKKSDDNK